MIRFYNGKTITFNPEITLSGNEVWIDGSTISYVGPEKKDKPKFEREINLNGNILLPGFKNAHTHTPMTFLRSLADDMELHQWLAELIWPNEVKLTDNAVYYMTKIGIMEYLTSGITASFDMYSHAEAYAQANVDCGFRTVMTSSMNNFDEDPTQIEKDYLHYNNYNELISYTLGLHAEYTTSPERIKYMASLAEKYKAPCYIHLCETKSEVEGCIERYGMTTPQYLDSVGFFKYGGGGYHCIYLNDDDISLFINKGLWAITCPSSNLKLASGIAPLNKLRNAGVNLAIGTDGAASNNALDMFREMYLAAVLQKYYENDAAVFPAEFVLKMACSNGALAMNLTNCDDIAVGKKADLAVIDLNQPNMQPINNIPKNIVYSGSKQNIILTMVNGKILYENGEFHINDDPEKIYAEANRFIKGIE